MMFKKKEPFLIGVAGGISSGKSTVCRKIIEEITILNNQHKKHILVVSLDSFYKKLTAEEISKAERGEQNLDHPAAFDEELAYQTMSSLIQGKAVQIPVYDKKKYKTTGETIKISAETIPDVVIIEGILVFYYPKIRELCQMKLFVDCDADTRLARRVLRDMKEYNRPLEHILNYYQKYVKPGFEEFCLPTKKYADVIIPRGAENSVAINLIVQHINDYLNSTTGSGSNHNLSDENTNNTVETIESPKTSSSNLIGLTRSPSSPSTSSLASQSSPTTPSKRAEASTRPH